MMGRKIRLGISTCPNDTFAFHALIHRRIDWRGLEFQVELLDIQQLNDRLFRGEFDLAKASFHAALMLGDKIWVMPSGSALGFGVGPLLLASEFPSKPQSSDQLTLCPGELTTAHLLFRLFYPDTTRVSQVVFSEIMPRLRQKQANFGVCIHEGRFTWESEGLHLIEDLGTRWESEMRCPLPLGGIVGLRSVGTDVLRTAQAVLRDSLNYGRSHRNETLSTMRKHAQEFSDEVLFQHVDLYVNEWTVELGAVGQSALDSLCNRAMGIGLIDQQTQHLKQLPMSEPTCL
jgi:1,4-dihydroxy-6-naphthoate synthase